LLLVEECLQLNLKKLFVVNIAELFQLMILTLAIQNGVIFSNMIKEHRWKCEGCDLKMFFAVDLDSWYSRQKLAQHERAISNHIFITKHEVTHNEKDAFKINYK